MWNEHPIKTGKKEYFNMAKLTDSDPMPIGKFKGETMENVPYWHLLWFAEQSYCPADVLEYVNDNRDVLALEAKRNKDKEY